MLKKNLIAAPDASTYPRGGGWGVKVVIIIVIACRSIWLRWIPCSSVKRGAWRVMGRCHGAIMRRTTSCYEEKKNWIRVNLMASYMAHLHRMQTCSLTIAMSWSLGTIHGSPWTMHRSLRAVHGGLGSIHGRFAVNWAASTWWTTV